MDAFLLHYGLLDDQQIPAQKSHIGKCTHHPFIPRSNFHSSGILQTPPPYLTHSYSLPQPPPPQRQPPLLPAPVAFLRQQRSSSAPPINNRTRDQNKYSKSPRKKTPPKKPPSSQVNIVTGNNYMDIFSGSMVFAISPPPSSLPFPSFLRKSKLNCNAEAEGRLRSPA